MINNAAYSMSKYAYEAFSDGLRMEMKRWGVSVHIIEPGAFKTDLVTKNFDAYWTNLWANLPKEIRESYGEEYLEYGKCVGKSLVKVSM